MDVERLNYLITVMERVRDNRKQFNMGSWARVEDGAQSTMCDTVCCALGYAAFDPKCIADGLHMVLQVQARCDEMWEHLPVRNRTEWDAAIVKVEDAYDFTFVPMYRRDEAFGAGQTYYDLSYEEADYLFDPSAYPKGSWGTTPDDVIEHINNVLTGQYVSKPDEDEVEELEESDKDEPEEFVEDDDKPVGFV
jgi:hypothetical protein